MTAFLLWSLYYTHRANVQCSGKEKGQIVLWITSMFTKAAVFSVLFCLFFSGGFIRYSIATILCTVFPKETVTINSHGNSKATDEPSTNNADNTFFTHLKDGQVHFYFYPLKVSSSILRLLWITVLWPHNKVGFLLDLAYTYFHMSVTGSEGWGDPWMSF